MSPSEELLNKAVAMLKPGMQLALSSNAHSYRGAVLLAIARPTCACVMRIDASEYDGLAVLRLAGMDDAITDKPAPAAPPDIEQLLKEKNALRKRQPG